MEYNSENFFTFYESDRASIINGDCRDVLAAMSDNSIDAVVTDPPYEWNFMSRKWDSSGIAYNVDMWRGVLRVLKPGGHMLCFGGARTHHRVAVAIEDAGFEIRDSIHWVYSSGFPHSHNIGKMLDKMAGAERKVVGTKRLTGNALTSTKDKGGTYGVGAPNSPSGDIEITEAATDEAKQWEGWGTCLKPSHEPVIMARKPLSESSIARNVLKWGAGGINIDGTRLPVYNEEVGRKNNKGPYTSGRSMNTASTPPQDSRGKVSGRWMPNFILGHHADCEVVGEVEEQGYAINRFTDGAKPFGHGAGHDYETSQTASSKQKIYKCVPGCPVKEIEQQGGVTKSGRVKQDRGPYDGTSHTGMLRGVTTPQNQYGDQGTVARYFPQIEISDDDYPVFYYHKKANKHDRNNGLDGNENAHPSVKPVNLMQLLVRLVTPQDGVVLDPFMGSGSTGVAAIKECVKFIGIEKDEEDGYCDIARRRITHAEDKIGNPRQIGLKGV